MRKLDRFEEGELLYECLFCCRCERLAQQYWRLVFNTIRKTFIRYNFPHTVEDIEDLRSLVFIKLFENNKRRLWLYDERRGSSLATWIMIITTRIVLNYIRNTRNEVSTQDKTVLIEEIIEEISLEDVANQIARQNKEDRIDLLHEAMKMLSSRDRLIVELRYYDGLPAGECAYILDMPANTFYKANSDAVKVRLTRLVIKMIADKILEADLSETVGDEKSLVYDVQIEMNLEILKRWVFLQDFPRRMKLTEEKAEMLSKEEQSIIKPFYFDKHPAEKCAEIISTSIKIFFKAKHDAIKRLAQIVTEWLKEIL